MITIKYPGAWDAVPLSVNISKWTFDEYFKFYPSNIWMSRSRDNNLLMPFTVQAAQSTLSIKVSDVFKNVLNLLQNQVRVQSSASFFRLQILFFEISDS